MLYKKEQDGDPTLSGWVFYILCVSGSIPLSLFKVILIASGNHTLTLCRHWKLKSTKIWPHFGSKKDNELNSETIWYLRYIASIIIASLFIYNVFLKKFGGLKVPF